MNFDWVEYYKLAQELAGTSQTPANAEAKMRAAISRMYYAAFCKARNYLRDREGLAIPAGARAHRFVRDTFRNSQDRIRQKVGDRLDKLRVHRNRADMESLSTTFSVRHLSLCRQNSLIRAFKHPKPLPIHNPSINRWSIFNNLACR